jgi:hypothetical protein
MSLSSEQPAVMKKKRTVRKLQHQHAMQQAAAGLLLLLLLLAVVFSRPGAAQQLLLPGLLWHQQPLLRCQRQRQQRVVTGVAGRRDGARLRSSCLSNWWDSMASAAGPSFVTLAAMALQQSGQR